MNPPLVLVADDSMVARAVLERQLAPLGCLIDKVESGAEVLARCREAPAPDVVLLDVEMPGMGGHEVLGRMQADPALVAIPVIFLSGRVSPEDVAEGLRLGAHDYLRKPVETSELVARVTGALRTKTLRDELMRRNAELREVARVDPLTGLLDWRGLHERLRELASAAQRHRRPLSAVLLDVDGLGALNETHGRSGGDEVLRAVARRLTARLRTEDLFGRWGGGKFLVLLADTPAEGAAIVAETLRKLIADEAMPVGEESVAVTATIGWAVTESGEGDDLLRQVDAAVLTARRRGPGTVWGERRAVSAIAAAALADVANGVESETGSDPVAVVGPEPVAVAVPATPAAPVAVPAGTGAPSQAKRRWPFR